MLQPEIILEDIEQEIYKFLLRYVQIQSFSFSKQENQVTEFLHQYFKSMPYFVQHPQQTGLFSIDDDPLKRNVPWALLKGNGKQTVVLMHHCDVVEIEDYGSLQPWAFSPVKLAEKFKKIANELDEDTRADLASDNYFFGRGMADMKGGGAIQLAIFRRLTELKSFDGNVLVVIVPDEENLSAGMRSAVILMQQLSQKYQLNYNLMINSEPHFRKDPQKGLLSLGSVGKMMPFVYVRGVLSHVGEVFKGVNPVQLLARIVEKTDLSTAFSDSLQGETSAPPSWLYMKDGKKSYDVSLPLSAFGCLSVHSFTSTPQQVLQKFRGACQLAFDETLLNIKQQYQNVVQNGTQLAPLTDWQAKVLSFGQLYREIQSKHGEGFEQEFQQKINLLKHEIDDGNITMIQCNCELVEWMFNYIDDTLPRVVYGLVPPYYPAVCNLTMRNVSKSVAQVHKTLNEYAQLNFAQDYDYEHFFIGISDLSYSSLQNSEQILASLKDTMPLLGSVYAFPAKAMEYISMPSINIGPYGKSIHKMTERVLKEDLLYRTPALMLHAIEKVLEK